MKTRTYTAEAPGPLMLQLRVLAGTVRVVVEDREHAEVTLTGRAADVIDGTRFAESYQRLKVDVPDPAPRSGGKVHVTGGNVGIVVGVVYGDVVMHAGGRAGGAVVGGAGVAGTDVDIRLPLHSSLCADTMSAPVSVTGALLTADVHTMSGAIVLDTVAGPRLLSMAGDITVANLIGFGSIETVSGDIDVTARVASELNAQSVSGDIRATGPIRLAAHSVSGRVRTY
jgi:hypothetical protein